MYLLYLLCDVEAGQKVLEAKEFKEQKRLGVSYAVQIPPEP